MWRPSPPVTFHRAQQQESIARICIKQRFCRFPQACPAQRKSLQARRGRASCDLASNVGTCPLLDMLASTEVAEWVWLSTLGDDMRRRVSDSSNQKQRRRRDLNVLAHTPLVVQTLLRHADHPCVQTLQLLADGGGSLSNCILALLQLRLLDSYTCTSLLDEAEREQYQYWRAVFENVDSWQHGLVRVRVLTVQRLEAPESLHWCGGLPPQPTKRSELRRRRQKCMRQPPNTHPKTRGWMELGQQGLASYSPFPDPFTSLSAFACTPPERRSPHR